MFFSSTHSCASYFIDLNQSEISTDERSTSVVTAKGVEESPDMRVVKPS